MADILRISDAIEEMDLDTLQKLITKWEEQVSEKFQPLYDAYVNKYKIFDKEKKDTDGEKPDHRVAVNFAAYIVDVFEGFFLGNPIKITSFR